MDNFEQGVTTSPNIYTLDIRGQTFLPSNYYYHYLVSALESWKLMIWWSRHPETIMSTCGSCDESHIGKWYYNKWISANSCPVFMPCPPLDMHTNITFSSYWLHNAYYYLFLREGAILALWSNQSLLRSARPCVIVLPYV